jgi:glyoxylase-like metal-dependent hydrolase (beta-lactamase superfamily II)
VTVAELRPGLFRVEEPDGRRRLCQYVVEGEERTLVVDAGLPESPERGLLALLQDKPSVVLLLTHPDADHRGGAPVVRDALPQVEIWCHELDRAQLSDPEVALAERYLAFAESDGVAPAPDRVATMRARLGRRVRIDRPFDGDTTIDLGGRRVDILHAPGHSAGSAVAWLPDDGVALIGDAAMGRGIPFVDGGLMYPPMYAPPRAYLETIARLEALRPSLILSGHEPPLEDDDAVGFLAESREAAHRLTALVRDALVGTRTLADLCEAVNERYGDLPVDGAANMAMTVDGTLAELGVAVEPGPPRRFRLSR